MLWKKLFYTILVFTFFIECKHDQEHEEKYTCNINGADLATTANTFAKASCENLPPEGIKVKVSNLAVPTGKVFALRFFTDPNQTSLNLADTSGIEIRWEGGQVIADFAQGENSTANTYGEANSFCIEIHNITKEKHLQIYGGSECSGNLLLNHSESTAPTPGTRGMAYRKSDDSVSIGNISIESDETSHYH